MATKRAALRLLHALIFMAGLVPVIAYAQSTVINSGGVAPGRVPQYVNTGPQVVVTDSGPASGGGPGVGLKELGLTVRGAGSGPYPNGGTGPFGANVCDYDNAVSTLNYHFLCFSPNAQGGALIATGAVGSATPQPLYFNINGTTYNIAAIAPIITIPGNTLLGNNTASAAAPAAIAIPGCSAANQALAWRTNSGPFCNILAGLSTPNTYTADNLFGSGRPWVDIRALGATCDNGVTDNGAIVQAAVNRLVANYGSGIVFVPPCAGVYCMSTPVTISAPSVTVQGASGGIQGLSILASCGVDITPLTMGGAASQIINLTVFGGGIFNPNAFGSTHPAISLTSGCVGCHLQHLYVVGGSSCLDLGAADALVVDVYAQFCYGTAIAYVHAGMWFIRDKFDQVWPVAVPASGTNVNTPWAASTVYAAGAVVSTQGYLIQAVTGGTSGTAVPTLAAYTHNFSDGTVTWTLAAPFTYYAIQLDTNGAEVSATQVDMSCACTAGFAMTNTLSGAPPSIIKLSQFTVGTATAANILLNAGSQVSISDGSIGSCILPGCAGINTAGAFGGDLSISGNEIFANQNGIVLSTGVNTNIISNRISGSSFAAVNVSSNIGSFNIGLNTLGTSAIYGSNARAVIVQAGSSDHYNIVNNIINGSTTGIIDSGTGTNKTISGNN